MQALISLLQDAADYEVLHLERKGSSILTLTVRCNDRSSLLGGDQSLRQLMSLLARSSRQTLSPLEHENDRRLRAELKQAIAYIQENLERSLSLQDIADAAGLSAYYVARLFKQSIGLTPHQYILQQRIERAKALLQQGGLSLAEIAVAVGFYDQAHFTNYFKRLTGMTPKAALLENDGLESVAECAM